MEGLESLRVITLVDNDVWENYSRQLGSAGMGRDRGWFRMSGFGAGLGGYCICPNCGYMAPRTEGAPYYQRIAQSVGSG